MKSSSGLCPTCLTQALIAGFCSAIMNKHEATLKWVLNGLKLLKAFISKNLIPYSHRVSDALPILLVGNCFLVVVLKGIFATFYMDVHSVVMVNAVNWSNRFLSVCYID